MTQAPDPTDDIAFSVGDRIDRELGRDGTLRLALIDAHNSYVEGKGDITYGTPTAEKLVADTRAALQAAQAAAVPGGIEVGVAGRGGYSIGVTGIGPQGIRALVIRAAGRTSGYVLIDGNNLVQGFRDPIVRALERVVDVAEVLTTDNHVVHEVDGASTRSESATPSKRSRGTQRRSSRAQRPTLLPPRPTSVRRMSPRSRSSDPGSPHGF